MTVEYNNATTDFSGIAMKNEVERYISIKPISNNFIVFSIWKVKHVLKNDSFS